MIKHNKKLQEEVRVFFILYNNGDVFYFNVDKNNNGEIKFTELYKNIMGYDVEVANSIEFNGDSFKLINNENKIVFDLDKYYKDILKRSMPQIEKVYIDEDLRQKMLETEMVIFDENTKIVPGLLEENSRVYTRKRI